MISVTTFSDLLHARTALYVALSIMIVFFGQLKMPTIASLAAPELLSLQPTDDTGGPRAVSTVSIQVIRYSDNASECGKASTILQ